MKIRLDLIKPAKNTVRSSFDREKIIELSKSIQEQGVIVPIKVRPIEKGYFEIIYGHRRVEAAKMAGLCEIEAIEEGMDDTHSLVQGLVENVVRENMTPIETAKALQQLIQVTNWSQLEIQRQGIMTQQRVSQFLALLATPEEVQALVANGQSGAVPEGKVTELHIREVKNMLTPGYNSVVTPDKVDKNSTESFEPLLASNNTTFTDIIKKVAKEGLTVPQTRQVTREVNEARLWGGDRAVKQVIDRPFEPEHKERASFAPKKEPEPEVVGEFSWAKEEHVLAMLESLKVINNCADLLIKAPEQRTVTDYFLKIMVIDFLNVMEKIKNKRGEIWKQ
jgi:ParB/RepB/Spo0J family partition protein